MIISILHRYDRIELISFIIAYSAYVEEFDYNSIKDGAMPINIYEFIKDKEYYTQYFDEI